MSDTPTPEGGHRAKKRRAVPLVWAGSLLGATLLVLGVSGTLSSWTTAIITNSGNTVAAANAVILQETLPGTTPTVCNSTDNNDGSNSYTCTSINKYGGTATPLDPVTNTMQSVTVNMKNTGTSSGALTLAPGTCVKSLGSLSASQSICDVALVTLKCTTPSSVDTTVTPVKLSTFAGTSISIAT